MHVFIEYAEKHKDTIQTLVDWCKECGYKCSVVTPLADDVLELNFIERVRAASMREYIQGGNIFVITASYSGWSFSLDEGVFDLKRHMVELAPTVETWHTELCTAIAMVFCTGTSNEKIVSALPAVDDEEVAWKWKEAESPFAAAESMYCQ